MARTYKFTKRDKNRYKKIYQYIRKKPRFQYCSDGDFKLVVGEVEFDNTDTATFSYPADVVFVNAPIITAISYDSNNNSAADVNIFLSSVSTSQVVFGASAAFSGKVHFQIISQD